jgi:hypothetical protein
VHAALASLALGLTALTLWALTHEYRGLVLDGQIYAVQALAKLRPSLNADLFLQNTSQDRFTIFPHVYAWVIAAIGLNPASMLLTAIFTVWFLYACWVFTAHVFSRDYAWLAVFVLLITGGHYGAFAVFRFLEPFLTARLPAEALVITALALTVRGWRIAGLVVASVAVVVHPLVALPGLLLLLCLWFPMPVNLIGAACMVLGCVSAGLASTRIPLVQQMLPPMDSTWAYIVRERSQFLFLQLWTAKDWELNLRPFVCVALTMMALPEAAVRKLALGAMLVGAAGLLIAAAASFGAPAVLLQGQAWRWVWITSFVSVVFLLPTARALWTRGGCGPACAVLSVAGWSFPAYIGVFFSLLAVTVWMLQRVNRLRSMINTWWMTPAVIIAVLAFAAVDTWNVIAALPHGSVSSLISSIRDMATARIGLIAIAALAYGMTRATTALAAPITIAAASAILAVVLLYHDFVHSRSFGSAADINEFADWHEAIPAASTVFVTNGHDSGSFVWFTLQRNNYLSPGQSAGVVFSRVTALEVVRRSQVLVPLVNESWKVLTSLQHVHGGVRDNASTYHHALTRESLIGVCSDRLLGFVISPDNVGFAPMPHARDDAYKNWNLYDCNRVRAAAQAS